MEDWITIVVCANACGDWKMKSMDIYHSDNPRILKRNEVMKSKLSAMWQSIPKSWCSRQFFEDWVYETFGRQVNVYLGEKQLLLECLRAMNNTTAHPQDLDDNIHDGFHLIKVKSLPPNTSPLPQPIDQQVISYFKKLYARALFRNCLRVTRS